MLEAFDAPDPATTCGRRLTTTLATQALVLLNDGFVRNQARLFAERIMEKAGPGVEPKIRTAYRLSLTREPSAGELESGRKFLRRRRCKKTLVDARIIHLERATYVD